MQGAAADKERLQPLHVQSVLGPVHRVVGHCRQCRDLDNKARGREDFTLYRSMIKSIRQSEEAYKDDSHIAFLFQVQAS